MNTEYSPLEWIWAHRARLALGMLAVAMVALVFFGGYRTGLGAAAEAEREVVSSLERLFSDERAQLHQARGNLQAHLNSLAIRVGQLQAQLLRLDALGERLTDLGKLDRDEFNFSDEPAVGGPDSSEDSGQDARVAELVAEIDTLVTRIDDRESKLRVIEELIMNRQLEKQLRPSGRPVKKGWVSSYFGKRTDPFTGKKTLHKGLDFAGKKGSDVIAVASGIVTYVGAKAGFGEIVEIQHGQGYATRYAHNSEVLVDQGDRITQGQVIALMGSSGRSTGPHVHFEVLKQGAPVDPMKFIEP